MSAHAHLRFNMTEEYTQFGRAMWTQPGARCGKGLYQAALWSAFTCFVEGDAPDNPTTHARRGVTIRSGCCDVCSLCCANIAFSRTAGVVDDLSVDITVNWSVSQYKQDLIDAWSGTLADDGVTAIDNAIDIIENTNWDRSVVLTPGWVSSPPPSGDCAWEWLEVDFPNINGVHVNVTACTPDIVDGVDQNICKSDLNIVCGENRKRLGEEGQYFCTIEVRSRGTSDECATGEQTNQVVGASTFELLMFVAFTGFPGKSASFNLVSPENPDIGSVSWDINWSVDEDDNPTSGIAVVDPGTRIQICPSLPDLGSGNRQHLEHVLETIYTYQAAMSGEYGLFSYGIPEECDLHGGCGWSTPTLPVMWSSGWFFRILTRISELDDDFIVTTSITAYDHSSYCRYLAPADGGPAYDWFRFVLFSGSAVIGANCLGSVNVPNDNVCDDAFWSVPTAGADFPPTLFHTGFGGSINITLTGGDV